MMQQITLTKRHDEIIDLIKHGFCLPREIAFQLKANKTNVSTALKFLLDNGYVVREKFYGTYIYALSTEMLNDLINKKKRAYSRQMELERDMFARRMPCKTSL